MVLHDATAFVGVGLCAPECVSPCNAKTTVSTTTRTTNPTILYVNFVTTPSPIPRLSLDLLERHYRPICDLGLANAAPCNSLSQRQILLVDFSNYRCYN